MSDEITGKPIERQPYSLASFNEFSYAPYNNPQIAISIVIENAGSGSSTAPIAKAIYSEYFKLNPKSSNDTHVQTNSLI